jgi:hypothetical protein
VVGGSGVEYPSPVVIVAALSDLREDLVLAQLHPLSWKVKRGSLGQLLHGIGEDTIGRRMIADVTVLLIGDEWSSGGGAYQKQCAFFFFSLGHMTLPLFGLGSAILAQVAFLATL